MVAVARDDVAFCLLASVLCFCLRLGGGECYSLLLLATAVVPLAIFYPIINSPLKPHKPLVVVSVDSTIYTQIISCKANNKFKPFTQHIQIIIINKISLWWDTSLRFLSEDAASTENITSNSLWCWCGMMWIEWNRDWEWVKSVEVSTKIKYK